MRFASLGSGSRGNGTIVASQTTVLLVDCGFSYKEALHRLKRLELEPNDLSGIVVTHEHGDHVSGVETLANKHSIPVYASRGTWIEIGVNKFTNPIYINTLFSIGDIDVKPVKVPHDAREPLQFVFSCQGIRLGILSDLGSVSQGVIDGYQDLDAISVEFNHDKEMLDTGPYPNSLKSRVGGDFGHLNNWQAAEFLRRILSDRLQTVVACHISEINNDSSRVRQALDSVLEHQNVHRLIASQSDGFNWIQIGTQ
ncbi:MAG: MBL fold metallo-hydrolase [Pseudomonadota bacterium]